MSSLPSNVRQESSGIKIPFNSFERLAAVANKMPNATVHELDATEHGFGVLNTKYTMGKPVWIKEIPK